MQIITIEDHDFPSVLELARSATAVGRYWRSGKVQMLLATNKFMLVLPDENPNKIGLRPVRSHEEATDLCRAFLKREEERGSKVELKGGG